MNKKFFRDVQINFFITFGISISLFFINKYFAFYLGAENLGLMRLFTQLLSYLNLAEIGIASASTYALYKPLVEKNYLKISIIMQTMKSLYTKIFFFILITGLLLNPIIPFFIKNSSFDSNIYLYWSLYVINTSLGYCFIKYVILFTADQKFNFVRLIQGGSKIFCQILQILIIIKLKSFFYFILVLILDNVIQFIFYKLCYNKIYFYIFRTSKKDNSITKNIKNLFWHKLAGLLVYNTDLILISKFISLEIVGIYGSYQIIVQMIITILGIVLNVLTPKVGKFIAENNKNEIFNHWKVLNILFLNISILCSFCTYILVNDFVRLWLGSEFILPKTTVFLIIINLFVQCFRNITDIFKNGSGFFDDIHLPILEAIINFIVSVILGMYIGLNGIIIGTIASNFLITCIAKPILVFRRCFNKSIEDYIKIYGNYLCLIFFSFLSCSYIVKILSLGEVNSWLEWIKHGIIIFTITLTIVFLIFLFNQDFRKALKLKIQL